MSLGINLLKALGVFIVISLIVIFYLKRKFEKLLGRWYSITNKKKIFIQQEKLSKLNAFVNYEFTKRVSEEVMATSKKILLEPNIAIWLDNQNEVVKIQILDNLPFKLGVLTSNNGDLVFHVGTDNNNPGEDILHVIYKGKILEKANRQAPIPLNQNVMFLAPDQNNVSRGR